MNELTGRHPSSLSLWAARRRHDGTRDRAGCLVTFQSRKEGFVPIPNFSRKRHRSTLNSISPGSRQDLACNWSNWPPRSRYKADAWKINYTYQLRHTYVLIIIYTSLERERLHDLLYIDIKLNQTHRTCRGCAFCSRWRSRRCDDRGRFRTPQQIETYILRDVN